MSKYARGLPAQSLMAEWIAAHAARVTKLMIPAVAVVEVAPEHRPDPAQIRLVSSARLNIPLFGLQFVPSSEVDQTTVALFSKRNEKEKVHDKLQLLRIALFDLWIANDDRNQGNYNLLLNEGQNGYEFIVIDHGAAFNTCAALNDSTPLCELTYDESLLSSTLLKHFFKRPNNFAATIQSLQAELDEWRVQAAQQAATWVAEAPEAWGVNKEQWLHFIQERLTTEDWIAKVKKAFHNYCMRMIN